MEMKISDKAISRQRKVGMVKGKKKPLQLNGKGTGIGKIRKTCAPHPSSDKLNPFPEDYGRSALPEGALSLKIPEWGKFVAERNGAENLPDREDFFCT
jgi:hypothetical protein